MQVAKTQAGLHRVAVPLVKMVAPGVLMSADLMRIGVRILAGCLYLHFDIFPI